jgi:hypothetical protein
MPPNSGWRSSPPPTASRGGATLISQRIGALFDAEAGLLLHSLTAADGHAYAGWNLATSSVTSTADELDSYTAAIRGLLAAYLATGNAAYSQRAIAVFQRMDAVFFDAAGQIYVTSPAPQATVAFTPARFALLEGALREIIEVAGAQSGQQAVAALAQSRITRVIKLVLDGWDDFDGNQVVDYATECVAPGTTTGSDGGTLLLGHGGLQMAERARSGELGSACSSVNPPVCLTGTAMRAYSPDREQDCVPEIGAVGLPSALASSITLQIQ